MRRSLSVLVLLAATALVSCRDQDITAPQPGTPDFAILDAVHGGDNPDFFFLPPLVPNPSSHPDFEADQFNPHLKPVVEICELSLEHLDADGNPTEKTPCAQDQPQGFPIVFTVAHGPDAETVKVGTSHYGVNWHTDRFELNRNLFYRIQVRVGVTPLGLADVDVLSSGRELRNVNTNEVIGLIDGRTLPLRFRIENGALCDPPGHKPCASSTFNLEEGGSVVLEATGDRIDIPPQEALPPGVQEVTVTVRLCDEDIAVDLPTFGNCLEITSDPALDETTAAESSGWNGLFPRAVVSMCSLIGSSELPSDPRRRLITLHRQNDAGDIQALPHTHSFCDEGDHQGLGSLWSTPFRQFAQRGMDALRRGASWLGSPRVLHARARALRLDIGHAGETPFISKFQFALPSQMEVVEGTNHQTAAGGAPVPEAPSVVVTDRDGGVVEGATVRFEVVPSGGSLEPAALLTVVSGVDGRASISDAAGSWVLGTDPGTYRLRAFGFGIAGTGDDGPFMPPLPMDQESNHPPDPVPLQEGEVIFTAAVCESEPCAVGTVNLAEGGSVVLEESDRIDIPAQDDPFVETVTVILRYCDGDIDADIPTFGNCLDIRSDPRLDETTEGFGGFLPRAVVSMCSLIDLSILPPDPQRRLITLHRQNDQGDIQALPHTHSFCDDDPQHDVGSHGSPSLRQFAQRGMDALRRGASWLGTPRALHARARALRLDIGHAGETPFISKFQFGLPVSMAPVLGTDAQSADVGTAVSVPPAVLVMDRDGNPVVGATVHFEVKEGGGSVDPPSVISALTGVEGSVAIAAADAWVLGPTPGTNVVRAFGKGIAGPGQEPFMPGLPTNEPEPEHPQHPVTLGTGEVTFTATGVEVDEIGLFFEVQPSHTLSGASISPAVVVRVLAASGAPLPGANVVMSDGSGNQELGCTLTGPHGGLTDTNGRAVFPNLVLSGQCGGATLLATGSFVGSPQTSAESEPFDVSADVNLISFVSGRDGNLEIYVMRGDGLGQTRLTDHPDTDLFPRWSPDREKIAFGRGPEPGADFAIWLMNSDGSGQTRLSPDGVDDDIRWFQWSPDGERIAFVRRITFTNTEIFVMDADGSNQMQLTQTGGSNVDPQWSPDGERILFTTDRDEGEFQLYVMGADGSSPTNLTDDPDHSHIDGRWSPDGESIAFVRGPAASTTARDIYVMRADGNEKENLTQGEGNNEQPQWSPDGVRILFLSDRSGPPDLHVVDLNGNITNVTNHPAFDGPGRWSPDGQRILFISDRDGNREVYVMGADGSDPMNLTNSPADDFGARWAPLFIVH